MKGCRQVWGRSFADPGMSPINSLLPPPLPWVAPQSSFKTSHCLGLSSAERSSQGEGQPGWQTHSFAGQLDGAGSNVDGQTDSGDNGIDREERQGQAAAARATGNGREQACASLRRLSILRASQSPCLRPRQPPWTRLTA